MNSKFYAQAEVFVEIVRQGSMTAAAATLRLSKSNVSQKLAEMESDLDIALLKRNTRSIQMTSAGRKTYDLCVQAVDALQHARGEVGQKLNQAEPQGVVTISGSNLYLSEFIMPLLSDLKERFPLVRIDLVGGDHPVDQRAEAVDLRIRVGAIDAAGVKTYALAPLERILCGHQDLVRAALTEPSSLSAVPLILRDQEKPEWSFRRGDNTATFTVTKPALHVNSYELSVAAVRAGLGAAVLAKAVVQGDLASGSLTELLPDWDIDPIPVSLVIPNARLRRSEVMAVARYITNAAQTAPFLRAQHR